MHGDTRESSGSGTSDDRRSCLRCDYSLHGLPSESACPECGHKNPPGSLVWRPRLPWWRGMEAYVLALIALHVPLAAAMMLFDGFAGGNAIFWKIIYGILVSISLGSAYFYNRSVRRSSYVCIDKNVLKVKGAAEYYVRIYLTKNARERLSPNLVVTRGLFSLGREFASSMNNIMYVDSDDSKGEIKITLRPSLDLPHWIRCNRDKSLIWVIILCYPGSGEAIDIHRLISKRLVRLPEK